MKMTIGGRRHGIRKWPKEDRNGEGKREGGRKGVGGKGMLWDNHRREKWEKNPHREVGGD